MFFRLQHYFRFILRSTNQHGVHSPFIYQLVTRCFYDKTTHASYGAIASLFRKRKPAKLTIKTARLLNRLPRFLRCKTVLIIEDSPIISTIVTIENTLTVTSEINSDVHYDMICVHRQSATPQLLDQLISKTHNDTVLLITNIHQSSQSIDQWQQLKTHAKTRVTIETFNLGFVFFRKEQAKEDFIIRK
ncbi:hypothetical protein ACFSTE_10485 [Aquimarina hainanensis]|uniref:Response regulatory domain-containing protein n=1 Tax=Aquimarina hainanensis TaxID=1578017 RepID=A0ABW5N7S6_9FLAO|nr:hypothetical protein [Aquimarina sp. TRL1]QKX05740.1 hypothetical protein HN014_12745 [Aquimarina sp. TRL1]